MTISRHDQSEIPASYVEADLYRFVAYRCIVGSKAYGLAQDALNDQLVRLRLRTLGLA